MGAVSPGAGFDQDRDGEFFGVGEYRQALSRGSGR